MMGLIVKLVLGVVLFAGSLVGGLAATGRLNHVGTANIPLLGSFFPAPPEGEEGAKDGEKAAGEHGDAAKPEGEAGKPDAEHGAATDAHATPSGESKPAAADASHDATQDPKAEQAPRKQKTGRSLVEPEKKADDGHGGGEAPAAGHGEDPHAKGAHAKQAKDEHAKPPAKNDKGHGTPEGDFDHLQNSLANGKSQYAPGELFRFSGLPAGITPEQINEAWQRVQGLVADIERRKVAQDLREQELRELNDDISKRQAALGKERNEVEQMQRELDAKIQRFQDQVKLVRNDEVAALKRNAQTLASFEPEKAAELIESQWKNDKGQDEVLKLLEFMDKDAVNEILKALPTPMTQDVMKKRMRVSKESTTPGKGN